MTTTEQAAVQRKARLDGALTHAEYFGWIADEIGRDKLTPIVKGIASTETIKANLAADEHLNNIPLQKWDYQDFIVRRLAASAGFKSWSLSDTVCTLKEHAKTLVA